jgi:5,10-methylenetetrahydromethanopterin reductase
MIENREIIIYLQNRLQTRDARVKFGILIPHMKSVDSTIKLVKLAEEKRYDFVWFSNATPTGSILCRDPYVLLTISAIKTNRVKLGVGVTNPYTRHPLLNAVALATIDEISDGRAILGIGASSEGILRPLGLQQRRPAVACREAIEAIKRLYTGKEVQYDGQMFRIDGSKLVFDVRKDIPVYLACRAPNTSIVAGMVADGAIIGSIKSQRGLTRILSQIKKGAEKASRNSQEIDLVSWVQAFISEDKKAAVEAAKPAVAHTIEYLPSSLLEQFGVGKEMYVQIKEALKSMRYSKAFELMTDETIDDWALAGTPSMCTEKIEELAELGITQVTIIPKSFGNINEETVIRTFGDEVIPRF